MVLSGDDLDEVGYDKVSLYFSDLTEEAKTQLINIRTFPIEMILNKVPIVDVELLDVKNG